jgi:hypothetical protein
MDVGQVLKCPGLAAEIILFTFLALVFIMLNQVISWFTLPINTPNRLIVGKNVHCKYAHLLVTLISLF